MNAIFKVKQPENEPIYSYNKGSEERKKIEEQLKEFSSTQIEIPIIIGGKEIKTGNLGNCICPHDHKKILGTYHKASEKEIKMAIEASMKAKEKWASMPWEHRSAIFLKMAELLRTKYRYILNAATMLAQSKTVFQAEIDSACELIDFFRFNVNYLNEIYKDQPLSLNSCWNRLEYRPLEGFIFAVTPFNFTSIAGNLPTAPALCGNTVVWKPASTAVYSGYFLMKLFMEAGLPDGVINFIPGRGSEVGDIVLNNENLGGIHFTGSTAVFQHMWKTVGNNINKYKAYPRIVGETGGKDFIFAHHSADPLSLAIAILRGSFEYQGQKCSAASRAYIPSSVWEKVKDILLEKIKTIKMGDITDLSNFIGAVIDKSSFDKLSKYINNAKNSEDAEILCGGNCDDTKGYFIEPTIIIAKKPDYITIKEELFGPVMTIYIYNDNEYEETLKLCDKTSPYALTGAIFSNDREAIITGERILKNAAGNFYINDKPTGAVVGQQPFGGARASGTNDKAGSILNLFRWLSPRTIKETYCAPTDYRYPHMD